MRISILVPHYKTGKMSAYTIAQLLKYKGSHDIEIIVIDNHPGDGSTDYFAPFAGDIKYYPYPKDRLQSHGVGIEYALENGFVSNEHFITIESDSFPTQDGWLDYYEHLINTGYDSAGSLLKLSGGEYNHPAGALYRKSVWQEAKQYCNAVNYAYFPNMSVKDGFNSHLMIHRSVVENVLNSPQDYVELSEEYKKLPKLGYVDKLMHYSPVVAPFHNGMGMNNESVRTYGNRNAKSEVPAILLNDKKKLIHRVGYEPGQWLCYFQLAIGRNIFDIPTKTKWLPGKENQQQEYTKMENGFTHLWSISSYFEDDRDSVKDITIPKKLLVDNLYNSLPPKYKI